MLGEIVFMTVIIYMRMMLIIQNAEPERKAIQGKLENEKTFTQMPMYNFVTARQA